VDVEGDPRLAHGDVQCLLAVFIAPALRRGLGLTRGRSRGHDEWEGGRNVRPNRCWWEKRLRGSKRG
jgi:hypothetical protein